MRSGGFGGPEGLATYLRATGIAAVFDATHPFAARITEHAARACAAAGVPRFRLQRAGWQLQPGDRWHAVDTIAGGPGLAAAAGTARVRDTRPPRAGGAGRGAGVHLRHPRHHPPPEPARQRDLGRGPAAVPARGRGRAVPPARGAALFIQASGGELTYAKIEAARELGLPVVMLTRPQPPEGASGSVPEALAWLAGVLGRRTCE